MGLRPRWFSHSMDHKYKWFSERLKPTFSDRGFPASHVWWNQRVSLHLQQVCLLHVRTNQIEMSLFPMQGQDPNPCAYVSLMLWKLQDGEAEPHREVTSFLCRYIWHHRNNITENHHIIISWFDMICFFFKFLAFNPWYPQNNMAISQGISRAEIHQRGWLF